MKVAIRKKKLKNGNHSIYLDIYSQGKRKYEFLNLYLQKGQTETNREVMKLAEKIRAERMLKDAHDEFGIEYSKKGKTSFLKFFENEIKDRSNFQMAFKHLKGYCNKNITFKHIDENWLEGFKNYMIKELELKPNTGNYYFGLLKATLKKAAKKGYIKTEIIDSVRNIKLQEVKRDYLTVDDINRLAKTECRNPEVKRAFLFCCFTGLRQSDLKLLKWADVEKGIIDIRQKKTDDLVTVPLGNTALAILNQNKTNVYPLPNTPIFKLPEHRKTINDILIAWFKKAGISKKAFFHLSRHTFATLSLTQGADLYTVSKLLGHKEIKTTQIYAKIVDEKKKEAVDKLPTIELG
jgi:integrase